MLIGQPAHALVTNLPVNSAVLVLLTFHHSTGIDQTISLLVYCYVKLAFAGQEIHIKVDIKSILIANSAFIITTVSNTLF